MNCCDMPRMIDMSLQCLHSVVTFSLLQALLSSLSSPDAMECLLCGRFPMGLGFDATQMKKDAGTTNAGCKW